MSNWFIITSAINVDYGFANNQSRFLQTIGTIDSIRHYCSNSKLVLIDSGQELEQTQFEVLKNKCEIIVPMNTNYIVGMIKQLYGNNFSPLKSLTELYMMAEILNTQNFIDSNDTVFKISGRYFLNSKFDATKHGNGKYVFRKHPNVKYYDRHKKTEFASLTDWQYKCRLHSFSGSLVPELKHKYKQMFNFLFDYYMQGQFTDVEHVMYKFIGDENVIAIDEIGVSGLFADNGEYMSE